jgi:ABC-type transport system involved in multi-copper enzyme maturation permease subunit
MIWIAWRQIRFQTLVVSGAVALLALLLALTGPHLSQVFHSVVLTCQAHNDCGSVLSNFQREYHWVRLVEIVVLAAPPLLGIFWGAPLLAREIESGTFRLAWTQSVSRSRWLLTKVILVGVISMVLVGLLSLMYTWWSSAYYHVFKGQFLPLYYLTHNVTPIGYAAFGFALGVALGVLIRRTVPAMAATLVGYVLSLFVFSAWVRPNLETPLRRSSPLQLFFSSGSGGPGISPNNLIVSQQTVDGAGRVVGQNGGIGTNGNTNFTPVGHGIPGQFDFSGVGTCPNKFPLHENGGLEGGRPSQAFIHAINTCVRSFHLRDVLSYQPASRYWSFQWYEMSIFIALAFALIGFAWWWVRRRLT